MYELRIYTLKTNEALRQYADVHWVRHVPSLQAFQITTHGVWTEHNDTTNRLFALVSYKDGADIAQVTADYMNSPEFLADMDGFDVTSFVSVESILLDATTILPSNTGHETPSAAT